MTRQAAMLGTILSVSLLALSACSSLPHDGPTEGQLLQTSTGVSSSPSPVVPITMQNAARLSADAQPGPGLTLLADSERSNQAIGVGDTLSVQLLSAGFLSAAAPAGATVGAGPSMTQSAAVDAGVQDDGTIVLPFAGVVHVAGLNVQQATRAIVRHLAGKLDQPQAVVSVKGDAHNTVIVSGDVAHPGRYPLAASGETISDAIAVAGGASFPVGDTTVELSRGSERASDNLGLALADQERDARLSPGDRVRVTHEPHTFTVLGAAGKVGEVPFGQPKVTLVEALARSGGLLDERADANAVFVFRVGPTAPTIYQLDMMQAGSYFAGQQFLMRDKDTIYIANAKSMDVFKVMNLFSTVMQPASVAAYSAK